MSSFIFAACVILLWVVVFLSLRNGIASWAYGPRYYKDKRPTAYWATVLFYILMACGATILLVLKIF